MAALSEVDLKKILGENYKEIEKNAQIQSGIQDADRIRAETISKMDNNKFNAGAVFTVGLILLVSNFLAISGPQLLFVTIAAAALMVVGVVWYVWLTRQLKQIKAAKA